MKVVYVAGPFRGKTEWEIHSNVHIAECASLQIAYLGAMPLCPHKNTEHFHGLLTDQFWLDGTLELLRRADAVLVLSGWEHSHGTLGEIKEAGRLGIPVFRKFNDLSDWIKGEEHEGTDTEEPRAA